MRLDSEGLRELYQRETSRAARGSATDCLSEETLVRTADGELDHSERERTADHLTTCSDCANEYRAINSLKPWAEDAAENIGTRIIPLTARDNGHRHPIAVEPTIHETRIGSRPFSFYLPYAVAAASLVLSLALGALLISKSRENQRLVAEANNRQATQSSEDTKTTEALAESRRLLEESTRRVEQESAARRLAEEELARRAATDKSSNRNPQIAATTTDTSPDVNVPIIDLNPRDAGRGAQNQQVTTIQLPADADLFTLILNLSGDDASRSHTLEITDRNNRAIWTSRNIRKSPYNNFTVALRRRSFPAGEYRLKIYGMHDGRRELIEEDAIRLAY